jgi:DNA-3-methyladenine glycosylase
MSKIDTNRRFKRAFFAGDTLEIARGLLGARLVRELPGGVRLAAKIVEVEAYIGQDDTACHARNGRTDRNAPMFGPPGHAYIYLIYGLYWLLNVVTGPEGFPAAVLIRAGEPLEGKERMRARREERGRVHTDRDITAGPGRLTQALAIDGDLNTTDLVAGGALRLEKGAPIPKDRIARGPRIGIGYAAEADQARPWRLWIAGNAYVSK